MQESTEVYNIECEEYANWHVPGKELDQLIRRWTVKRLWEEDLQQYETLSQTLKL